MSVRENMVILGAGLSGLLTAWRCLELNPKLKITLIDANSEIAGDHTWSFNLNDIDTELQKWVRPFIAHQWDAYDVKFPTRQRTLNITYCTGNSETLKSCVRPLIDSGRLSLKLNSRVQDIGEDIVFLEGGEEIQSALILDARGFEPNPERYLGYQKFVGHVIRTEQPHGVERPIIMDATVPQLGGYRFVYCLPYSDTELLVEDTYYADGADMKSQEVDARIRDYIESQLNITSYEVARRETGILPITIAIKPDVYAPMSIGIRGGYYHAVTGYSFPDAAKVADRLAHQILLLGNGGQKITNRNLQLAMHNMQREHYSSERFFRLLNRMLFRAAKPQERYMVLQRFYGLGEGLIERFYAGDLTWRDKVRILIGKPPVPVFKALQNLSESAFIRRERNKGNS